LAGYRSSTLHTLAKQFASALGFIEVKGAWRDFAAEAQTQIRTHLEGDSTLKEWGLETVLIGSYGRGTAIWPGKDVDVFAKLSALRVGDTDPAAIFDHVRDGLVAAYGDRAEPQNRSVKVSFDRDGFEFSVDVVPAVRWEDRWAIPTRDVDQWGRSDDDRWVATDPEQLAKLTTRANGMLSVGSQGAYVPVVKLLRQTRSNHRGDLKPGGFYFELMAYQTFATKGASGDNFAQIFAATLGCVARQLLSGVVADPVLDRPYAPVPDSGERLQAGEVFGHIAEQAQQAISTDDICQAGALWREILGTNDKGWCFPPPDGCDEHGRRLAVSAPAVSRGSREPGGFA
jgi:hypothetical protein